MGSGVGSIESSMERIFREARLEILLTSFAISNATDLLLEWFEAALVRGVLIRLVINRIQEQPAEVVGRLHSLYCSYPHFYLYSFEDEYDLHAKIIVADRKLALVGSSNMSRRGLLNNHELALLVEGNSAEQIAFAFDRLLVNTSTLLIAR
jgi:phosphatidylserine/phosphatidylglycerophosphate/cardiolipin synthase-like enzyme